MEKITFVNKEQAENADYNPPNAAQIVYELEARVYSLSLENDKMLVSEFRKIPEVKEIMIAVAVLNKYYP